MSLPMKSEFVISYHPVCVCLQCVCVCVFNTPRRQLLFEPDAAAAGTGGSAHVAWQIHVALTIPKVAGGAARGRAFYLAGGRGGRGAAARGSYF